MQANVKNINGWSKKRVGEIATRIVVRAGTSSTPYIEIGDIDVERKQYSVKDKPSPGICVSAENKDVIVSKVRPTRGAVVQLQRRAFVSPAFSVLRAASADDADFLFYALSREDFFRYLGTLETGTTYPSCDDKDVENYEISFPENQKERKKVAEIISAINITIEQSDALIKKYERVRVGMMQDLFQYGIDEKGRMRSEKTHKFKVSSLGKIPQEWEVGSITSFVNNSNPNAIKPGPFGSSIKKEIYTQKGYKVYGQEQVISGNPHFGNYYVDRKKFKELEAFKIEPGDILLSLVGTIGNVLILPSDCEAGIINPRLLKITPDKNKCETRFLAHSLLHSNTNIQLNRMATGGTMPVLNKGIVTSIEFVVPPVAEQHIIANTISALDKKIEFEAKELNKLVSLKRGLMTDLLTGAVRTIEK